MLSPEMKQTYLLPLALVVFGLVAFFSIGPSLFQLSALAGMLVVLSLMLAPSYYKSAFKQAWPVWALLIVVITIGIAGSILPKKSVKGGGELIRGAAIFFAGGAVLYRQRSEDILKAGFVASIISVILLSGLYGYSVANWEGWSLRDNPVLSELISGVHEFANVASLVLIALVSALVLSPNYRRPIVYVVLAITLFLLAASDSLGGYLAMVYCFLYALTWRGYAYKVLFYVALAALLIAMTWVSFFMDGFVVFGFELPPSFQERILLYQSTWGAIADSPMLGYGLNTFKYATDIVGAGLNQVMPHNIFLEMLFSVGVIGLALFLISGGLLMKQTSTSASSQDTILARIGALFMVYLAVRGLTELHMSFKVYAAFFVAILLMGSRDWPKRA